MSTKKTPEEIAEERYPHEKIDSPTMRVHRQFMRNGYATCYREHVLIRPPVTVDGIMEVLKNHAMKNTNGWSAAAIDADLRSRLESYLTPNTKP